MQLRKAILRLPSGMPGRRIINYSLVVFLIISLAVFLLVEGLFYVERRLRPAILSAAEVRADILATEAINRAVIDRVSEEYIYGEIISIERNEEGRIVMAGLNTGEVNRLMAETTLAAQHALTQMGTESFSIPLGEIWDNYIIAAYGPDIPVRLMPMGRVNTSLQDDFEHAGINQVRHKILLDVVTEVRVIVPFISTEVEVFTSVPVADTIYPGEVPDTVVNLNLSELGNSSFTIPEFQQ